MYTTVLLFLDAKKVEKFQPFPLKSYRPKLSFNSKLYLRPSEIILENNTGMYHIRACKITRTI